MTTITLDKKHVALRALRILRDLQKQEREWQAEAEEYAKQGHRPHYCIHGTNQWTDYDNICGGCEEGLTLREQAIRMAHDELHTEMEAVNALATYIGKMRALGGTEDEVLETVNIWSTIYQRRQR